MILFQNFPLRYNLVQNHQNRQFNIRCIQRVSLREIQIQSNLSATVKFCMLRSSHLYQDGHYTWHAASLLYCQARGPCCVQVRSIHVQLGPFRSIHVQLGPFRSIHVQLGPFRSIQSLPFSDMDMEQTL